MAAAAAAAASRGRSGFVWRGSDGESTCLADRGEECIYPLAWEELFEKKMGENQCVCMSVSRLDTGRYIYECMHACMYAYGCKG